MIMLLNDLLLYYSVCIDNKVRIDYHVTDRKSAEKTVFQRAAWRKIKTEILFANITTGKYH